MTAQQIAAKLRQAGFIAILDGKFTHVSLQSRKISVAEIHHVFTYAEQPDIIVWPNIKGVTVMGLEE